MRTIIGTATDAGKFTILLGALTAASLIDTLRTTGPYTLFAPSDEAFKRLAPGALDSLLADTNRLYAILAYHVVSGAIEAKDMTSNGIKTIAGTLLVASRYGDEVFVNGVKVTRADIAASNGVVHMIDAVIMPLGTVLAAA